jgi:hypothetical protein
LRSLYEIADAKKITVGELTGTRRRYSKIKVPDKWRAFIGEDELVIEHVDEGMSVNEIPYWNALWNIKQEESKKK